MDGRIWTDKALLVSMPEECSMIDSSLNRNPTKIPIRVPCVDVGVEMNNGDRSVDFVNSVKDG